MSYTDRINQHLEDYHDAYSEHFFVIEKEVGRESGLYTRVTGSKGWFRSHI
jgi:hypothetical protein